MERKETPNALWTTEASAALSCLEPVAGKKTERLSQVRRADQRGKCRYREIIVELGRNLQIKMHADVSDEFALPIRLKQRRLNGLVRVEAEASFRSPTICQTSSLQRQEGSARDMRLRESGARISGDTKVYEDGRACQSCIYPAPHGS